MARKSRPHDEELPFVALMDTMTNVVGVLIIVLVMIGIGLAKSVQKVLSDLPMVTEEEHAKLKEEMKEFDTKKDPKELEAEMAKLKEELDKTLAKLKELEKAQEKDPIMVVDLKDAANQLAAARKERMERKTLIDQLLAEIDKLKLKLDTTPAYVPPPGIAVRLPAPKPMPDNAEIQRVLVTGGKLVFLRNEEFWNVIEEEFKKENPAYLLKKEMLKGPDGKPLTKKGPTGQNVPQRKMYFDNQKMAAYFNKFFNGRKPSPRDINRDLLVEVAANPNSPTIQLRLAPRPDGGESVEQAVQQASFFRSQLRAMKTNPKSVLWFHVCKDSIPTYLAARDIVDREQLPVGWEMFEKPLYTKDLPGDYIVEFTPAPPPPPPAPLPPGTAPKPPPVTIAAPKISVD